MLWIAELEGEIAIVDDELTDRDKSHVDAYSSHHGTLAEVITQDNFKILNHSLGWADKEEIQEAIDNEDQHIFKFGGVNPQFVCVGDDDTNEGLIYLWQNDENIEYLGKVDEIGNWSSCTTCGAPADLCNGEYC